MIRRYIDWIWHIRGSLAIVPARSNRDAFDRLDPLFRPAGTTYQRTDDTLVFQKKDQASQDKMSIFDDGVLRIERTAAGSVLRYDLASRALLFCFLAPLLFLGIAQLTNALVSHEKAQVEAGKDAHAPKKPQKKLAALPMSPVDKFLGAPAPEKPKKKPGGAPEEGKGKLSAKPAYIFSGIFVLIYVIGRILEDRLIRALFRKKLQAGG